MNRLIPFVLAAALVPTLAFGQAETTGSVSGSVADEDGRPLVSVKVTVSGPAIQGERSFSTDKSGKFLAPFLPPGTYVFELVAPSMKPDQYTVRVGVGQSFPLSVTMKKGEGISESVTVYGSLSKLDTTAGGESFSYDKTINQLPVVNRTLEAVATLAPNISFGPTPGTLSIAGAPSFDTTVLLDGAEISDPYFGSAPVVYMEQALEEVQVMTSGVSARYGRFQGGVINAVTKSGGNTFDGEIRVDVFNESWNDTSPANETQSDTLNQVYSGTFGGPILKDHLWFFLGARYIPTQDTNRQTALTLVDFTTQYDETRYSGKLTGAITPDHVLSLGYLQFSGDTTSYAGLPPADLFATTGVRSDPRKISTFEYQGILTDNMFLNFQATRKRVNITAGASDPSLGSPFLDFYGSSFQIWHNHWWDAADPSTRNNDTASIGMTNVISAGSWGDHTLEYGFQYVNSITGGENRQSSTGLNLLNYDALFGTPFTDTDANLPGANPSDPRFNLISYYDLLAGAPGGLTYKWIALPLGGNQELKNYAVFIQDGWQKGKWRVDAGLRYEQYKGTGPQPIFDMNFAKLAPRLGVTYNIDQNWQLQATWGRYVSRFNDNVAAAVTGVSGAPYVVQLYTGPTQCPIGTYCMNYDDVEAALQNSAYWGITTKVTDTNQPTRFLADNINAPYADDLTFSVKRALPHNSGTFTLNFVNRQYRDLLSGYVGGQGPPVTVTDPLGSGLVANYDRTIWQNAGPAKRDYNALSATFDYRPSARWNVGGNYTYSTTQGNYEGEGRNTPASGSIIGVYPNSVNQATAYPYGYLSDDIRHRLRTWANYTFDFHRSGSFVVGAIGTYQSGLPYSLSGNQSYKNDPNYLNDQGSYTYFTNGRGNQRFGGFWAIDLSGRYQIVAAKDFSFSAQLIVRNVTNQSAMIAFNTGGSVAVGPNPGEQLVFVPGSKFGTFRNNLDFQTPRSYNFNVGFQF